MLYYCLNELPAPWFAASQMKLPCIAFQLPAFSAYQPHSGRVYRVDTLAFEMVEIKTRYDLSDECSVSRSPLVGHSPGARSHVKWCILG